MTKVEALHANEVRILAKMDEDGTYIRPWVDEKMKTLGMEYVDYMEY